MNPNANIIEIFSSIQGEGLWIGRPQVFVRFQGCKLKCTYCDTPLTHMKIKQSRIEYPPYSHQFENHDLTYSTEKLNQAIHRFEIPCLTLTGGEPLEQIDFLEEWLPSLNHHYQILLETSGIEVDALKRVVEWVDMISLDIKLPSSSKEPAYWGVHENFLKVAQAKDHYAKIVFDETFQEENELKELMEKFPKTTFIFQPVSPLRQRDLKKCFEIFQNFSSRFPNQVRLIPQTHKSLGVL